MDLILGNYHDNIKCESFLDPETGRIRVRPLSNQGLPTNIVIECSSKERKAHPIGTKFRTENVKVCKKPTGRTYLYAKDKMIYKL
ncbi:hypothetical protein [Winogradskyella helgolandensis]|uniref:hypothetical protein n=1 Tax=Winogradskyella helgolandensis TaxID=2697010 RepID=UPI0015CC24B7|nr:hypothetical protein [Winogradskyella helgolandensis]